MYDVHDLAPKLASVEGMTNTYGLNLTTHRAPASVWGRSGWDGTPEPLTVSRWLIGAGGGALVIQGLRQRNIAGSLLAAAGASLALWALTGEGGLSEARRWCTSVIERAGWTRDDPILAASADSFPASDAPAWTPTVGAGLRRRPAPSR